MGGPRSHRPHHHAGHRVLCVRRRRAKLFWELRGAVARASPTRQNVAGKAPDRLCETENTGAGNALRGETYRSANPTAGPEFFIPISADMVRRNGTD